MHPAALTFSAFLLHLFRCLIISVYREIFGLVSLIGVLKKCALFKYLTQTPKTILQLEMSLNHVIRVSKQWNRVSLASSVLPLCHMLPFLTSPFDDLNQSTAWHWPYDGTTPPPPDGLECPLSIIEQQGACHGSDPWCCWPPCPNLGCQLWTLIMPDYLLSPSMDCWLNGKGASAWYHN